MGDGQHPYQYQYQQPSEGSVRRISDHTRPPHGWTAPQSNPYPPPPPVAYDRGSPASVKEEDKGKGKDDDPLSLVAGFDPRLLSGRVKLATKNTTNSACINCHKRKRKVSWFTTETDNSAIAHNQSVQTVQRARLQSASMIFGSHQSKLVVKCC